MVIFLPLQSGIEFDRIWAWEAEAQPARFSQPKAYRRVAYSLERSPLSVFNSKIEALQIHRVELKVASVIGFTCIHGWTRLYDAILLG